MPGTLQGFIYVGRVDNGKWLAVVIDEHERVVSLSLPKESEAEAVNEAKSLAFARISYRFRSEMDPFIRRVGREVVEYVDLCLKGEKVKRSFNLNVDGLSDFMKRVLSVVSIIPRGLVTCYGSIAEVVDNPRASRAVGNAVAKNPWPIIVPCHRVVRSDLSLGGYRGGLDIKKRLLRVEGVAVTSTGKVLPSHVIRANELVKMVKAVDKLSFK